MSVLDDAGAIDAGDPSGALAAISGWPQQVSAAIAAGSSTVIDVPASAVLFCGMGGSAVGGDVLAAIASDSGGAPVFVHRSYGVPRWCGPDTFVIVSSYSGTTGETIDAFRAARAAGAHGLAVTSGGPLGEEARAAGWAVLDLPGGLMPRYALGWLVTAPLAACAASRWLDLGRTWEDGLVEHLGRLSARWGPSAPVEDNVAKSLAHELVGALPVVWGGTGTSAVAAYRWKTDLNENAKTPALSSALPELDHNEVVAWARDGADARPGGKHVLVLLRDTADDEAISARFDATAREVGDAFDLVYASVAGGPGPLGSFFEHALLGGFVSVYLALLRGVDPTPIDAIGRIRDAVAHLHRP